MIVSSSASVTPSIASGLQTSLIVGSVQKGLQIVVFQADGLTKRKKVGLTVFKFFTDPQFFDLSL